MTDLSAVNFQSADDRVEIADQETSVSMFLSALLVVGLPTTFWMVFLEFVNRVAALGMTVSTRLIVAGCLISLLTLIWGFITVSARQRRQAMVQMEANRPTCEQASRAA